MDHALADRYRRILLDAEHVKTLPVTEDIADEAAEGRKRQHQTANE